MKQRFRFVLALALVAVIGGLVCLTLRPTDRDFHGKPERFWINSITNGGRLLLVTNSAGGAKLAFPIWQQFGAEGVPLLVKALTKGDRPYEKIYLKLWPKLPLFLSGWLPTPTAGESQLRIRAALILRTMGSSA